MASRGPASVEFSRIVAADEIGKGGLVLDIAANADERAGLARRFGLDGLRRFEGRARLTAIGDGRIRLQVTFDADVLQSCVITLEPVESHISDRFEVVYAPGADGEEEGEVFVDVASEDPPEPLIDSGIDVGEITAQHLAMLIDPYPRASEAPGGSWQADDAEVEGRSPFEKLKRWKARN